MGRRIEQSIGGLLAYYASAKGVKNADPYSFMPHEIKPQEMSLEEQMMQLYGGN